MFLGLQAVLLGGCGDSSTVPPGAPLDGGADAGELEDDAGGFDAGLDAGLLRTVRVGTGLDTFEPLAPNQVIEMVQGPQSSGDRLGGFHVWAGVETRGYNPTGMQLSWRLTSLAGLELARIENRRLTLVPEGDAYVAHSITLILDDCCLAKNADLMMRVEVRDLDGLTGEDEVQVRGGAQCFDTFLQADVCP